MTIQSLIPWIDLLWIPVGFLAAERGKRLFTAAFAGACWLLLRLQVELLQSIGYPRGFFGMMDGPILTRGMITYSIFIMIFLILAHYSHGTYKSVHIAASITIMIVAFCVSTLVMVL